MTSKVTRFNSNVSQAAVDNTTSNTTGKDITDEIEIDKDEVELFSIEELVPSNAPLTVPYLEIYRTNELEYIPYISPYNVGTISSSDSGDSDDTASTDTSSTDSNSENSDNNSQSSSSSSSSSSSWDSGGVVPHLPYNND